MQLPQEEHSKLVENMPVQEERVVDKPALGMLVESMPVTEDVPAQGELAEDVPALEKLAEDVPALELEPVELPQEVQHVVESPQQKQPVVKLLSADEERWHWQELAPPKLEPLLKEVLLEMKLPMKQKQPQKMGERGSSLYPPTALALGRKLPSEEKICQETGEELRIGMDPLRGSVSDSKRPDINGPIQSIKMYSCIQCAM
jgi:hypothetical protein